MVMMASKKENPINNPSEPPMAVNISPISNKMYSWGNKLNDLYKRNILEIRKKY